MTAETTYEAILIQLAVIWISNSDRKQIQFAPSSRAGPTQKGDPLMFICPMTNFAISVTFFSSSTPRCDTEKDIKFMSHPHHELDP